MKRWWLGGALVAAVGVLGVASYLTLWPVPVDPEAWEAPPGRNFEPTGILAGLERVELPDGHGPEDVEVDAAGRVVVGLDDGRILRWDEPGSQPKVVAETGGRPLGLHWAPHRALLVADAWKGLLRIDMNSGRVRVLATECGGRPLGFTDDLETGPDGRVWFSDASVRFRQPDWKLDLLENRPNGRLCVYDPVTGSVDEVIPEMYFANGVAVDPKGRFVLVNETSRYRVRKFWLAGPKKGTDEILIDDLPGFPDGISSGRDGVYWIAIASPRSGVVDATAAWPALRRMMVRLPDWIQPAPERTARVLGIDEDGNVQFDLFDPDGRDLHVVTSVQERAGYLYLGSLVDSAWARVPVPRR